MGRFGPIPKSALVANCLENLQGQNSRRVPVDEKSELAQQSQNLSQQDVEDELLRLKMENRVLMEQLMEMGIMQTTASLAQSAHNLLPSAPLPLEFKSVKEREKERREKIRQLQREGKRKMEDFTDWFDGDHFSVKIAKQEISSVETDEQMKKEEEPEKNNVQEDNNGNSEDVKQEQIENNIVDENMEDVEQKVQNQDLKEEENVEIKKEEPKSPEESDVAKNKNEFENEENGDKNEQKEKNRKGKDVNEEEKKQIDVNQQDKKKRGKERSCRGLAGQTENQQVRNQEKYIKLFTYQSQAVHICSQTQKRSRKEKQKYGKQRSEGTRLNSSHEFVSRMPSSA
eukprot:TRINITY_DN5122_c0_g1_i4.p2 TRINITY_DN5122_c0_g1~~TRINITY_DN5122_c0_g1_i4.p2  ORF type:complete len:342 (-),score=84.45 TRINITY_DN5122_c0_g1_i4:8-1033(-)